MINHTQNNNHFSQILHQAKAILTGASQIFPCELIDLSLKGCLLRFEAPWVEPLEEIFTLEIKLPDNINITMQVSVTHVVANNASFKCEHIGSDSISQLHRLVKDNLADRDILERELLELSDLNK